MIAVGLFAGLNLLLTWHLAAVSPRAVPHRIDTVERIPVHTLYWVNGLAALIAILLAILIAPYLVRTFERMQQRAERQNNELRSLHVMGQAINAELDLGVLLQMAVKEATLAVDGGGRGAFTCGARGGRGRWKTGPCTASPRRCRPCWARCWTSGRRQWRGSPAPTGGGPTWTAPGGPTG